MAITKNKTMIVYKTVTLATLAGVSGLNDADLLTATKVSIFGDALKFELSNTVPSGTTIVTVKGPILYVPLSTMSTQFPTIWSALGGGLDGVMIDAVALTITFIGKEQAFS